MVTTAGAKLLELDALRVILFIFNRIIIPLFAFAASKLDKYSVFCFSHFIR